MRWAPLVLVLSAAPGLAAAQPPVAASDIQRLQDSIYDASRDVSDLRIRDAAFASQLQSELDDARDEAIYLKVKLRKREPIARREIVAVRDRVESIRDRARGDMNGRYSTSPSVREGDRYPAPPPPPPVSRRADPNEIPVGTEFDVRLQTPLSSRTAEVEDRFEVTTIVDLRDERNRVLVPAGSIMRGVVTSVRRANRVERRGSLTVSFDRLTIDGRSYPLRATVTDALESEGIRGEAGRIGIGAGAGAILGAILGGAKGALAGILIGGGGTIAATEGTDVELPVGTVLRVRLDEPLALIR